MLITLKKRYITHSYDVVTIVGCDRVGFIGDNGESYTIEGVCYENKKHSLIKECNCDNTNT